MRFAFPDAEAVLIQWLSQQLHQVRVVATLPGEMELHLPVVQVTRIGGSPRNQPWSPGGPLHDRPSFDVDAYAATRETAADLARAVSTLIPEMRGVSTGGAVITHVTLNTAPAWRPDYNPRVARFGATVEITLRPA